MMKEYQREFLQLCLDYEVLTFGEFTLKSGRKSPYFFNMGKINDGEGMHKLANCYASALQDIMKTSVGGDEWKDLILFGPAYKGIPLVACVSSLIYEKFGVNVGFAYNRKEAKAHGEGGQIVGSLKDECRLFLLDDVVTAGTAIRECIKVIRGSSPTIKIEAVLVALDRQEKISETDGRSTIQAVKDDLGTPVYSIVSFQNVLDFLAATNHPKMKELSQYRETFGSKT